MIGTVSFAQLMRNYPTNEDLNHDALFAELGWDDLIKKPAYENTCAIRMSYCLVKSGVDIAEGRFKIKKGPYKGKCIEPGHGKLSHILAQNNYFGPPRKFKRGEEDKVLEKQRGILSFFEIPGYLDGRGGHIDIIREEKFLLFFDMFVCGTHCYWSANEFWFWPIK
jgi:hypothetical protein